jgi:hypothetical protein
VRYDIYIYIYAIRRLKVKRFVINLYFLLFSIKLIATFCFFFLFFVQTFSPSRYLDVISSYLCYYCNWPLGYLVSR